MVVQIIRTTGREKKQAEREGESLQGNVTRGRGERCGFVGERGGREREREREKRRGKDFCCNYENDETYGPPRQSHKDILISQKSCSVIFFKSFCRFIQQLARRSHNLKVGKRRCVPLCVVSVANRSPYSILETPNLFVNVSIRAQAVTFAWASHSKKN